MAAPFDLSIIIVSHNTKEFTLNAIQKVHATVKTHTAELIVVENGSTDGSYEAIQKTFPADVVLKTEELVGFSAANNIGAQKAQGEYLLFLNPDTEVQDGAIDLMLEHARSLSSCGVISGQLINSDGSIQPQGGALPTLVNIAAWMLFIDDIPFFKDFIQPYQQRDPNYFTKLQEKAGWVGGTALLLSKVLFEKIGGWDDKIFLYAEDVELCLRVHKAGKTVCIYPGAKIVHHQNKSTGSSKRAKIGEVEGLIHIWKKHRSRLELPILRFLLFMGSWLRVLLFGILMRNEAERETYLEAQKRARVA